jgi:hypothetical protein
MLFDWDAEIKPTWEHLLRSWSRAGYEIEGTEKEHQDAKADADELLTLRISEIKTKGTAWSASLDWQLVGVGRKRKDRLPVGPSRSFIVCALESICHGHNLFASSSFRLLTCPRTPSLNPRICSILLEASEEGDANARICSAQFTNKCFMPLYPLAYNWCREISWLEVLVWGVRTFEIIKRAYVCHGSYFAGHVWLSLLCTCGKESRFMVD